MFKCNCKELKLSFNEFHDVAPKDMPQYGEYCLLELRDGRLTAGEWLPKNYNDKKSTEGKFNRGTADSVDASEVVRWHSLDRYDLTECLKNPEIGRINMGVPGEDVYSKEIGEFRFLRDRLPKREQFCLLILKNGSTAAGRWDQYGDGKDGCFIYASALASHSKKSVWAWTALSPDDTFEAEQEREKEKKREIRLNKNPKADPEKFKYGTDIEVYYEKALEKLKKDYPWATLAQMKKKQPYVIIPRQGKLIFGQDNGVFYDTRDIYEWTGGSTADEFIDFLCEYTRESVENSNPDVKFSLGKDIKVYLDRAYENVKKDYRWFDKKNTPLYWRYSIELVDGDWEFVQRYHDSNKPYVMNCGSSEEFIESVERECQEAALRANPVVAEYKVPFGGVDIFGWHLERYEFYKLKTGDYKAFVQAGDRTTGGSRTFFITPYCFEAKTYEEFLDRYLKIVPGGSFGLYKEDLLPDKKLKAFLGY